MKSYTRFNALLLYFLALLGVSLWTIASIAAEPVTKVAIIDTGLDRSDPRFKGKLCATGHYNFVDHNEDTTDTQGHGTYMAGLIVKYAKNLNYCLIIYRFYSERGYASTNIINAVLATRMAIKEGVTYVNASFGGKEFSEYEYLAIKSAPQVIFVAAAGNDGKELNKTGYFYPASYDLPNIIVVGATDARGARLKGSNYGSRVGVWELGDGPLSALPEGRIGAMSGTSVAAAIHLGRLLSVKGLRQ